MQIKNFQAKITDATNEERNQQDIGTGKVPSTQLQDEDPMEAESANLSERNPE